jgi:hypothetical protein
MKSEIVLAVVKRGDQFTLCVRRYDQLAEFPTTFDQLTPVFAAVGGVILVISSAPAGGEQTKSPDAGASENQSERSES